VRGTLARVAAPNESAASRLAFPARWLSVARRDRRRNARFVRGDGRFLALRDPCVSPGFYSVLLRWLEGAFPAVRARFELRLLPCRVRDWSRYALLLPWLQDPVEAWSPWACRRTERLQRACDERGIAVVNRVERLGNAGKAEGARRIAATGLRTPRMARIEDAEAFRATRLGLSVPLFVREDWGHGGAMLRADTEAEARALPLEGFRRPVAVEVVDVRSPDGLWRKYRTFVAGDAVVRQTMHVRDTWCVRGSETVYTEALRDEEVHFASRADPDPRRWVAAREALDLDFVAFDHSVTPDGETVVWEANPYPYLHFVGGRREYRRAPTERVLAAMARLYLRRAGIAVPEAMEAMLDPAASASRAGRAPG
jgi:hypothetical protein